MGWSLDNLVHCSPPVILQTNPASFPISLSDSSHLQICHGLQQPVQNTKALVYFVPAIQSSNDASDVMRQISLPIPIMDLLLCIGVCGTAIWFSSVSVKESEFSAWKTSKLTHLTAQIFWSVSQIYAIYHKQHSYICCNKTRTEIAQVVVTTVET